VWATCSSGLKGHVLVGGEESHELGHLDDFKASTLVHIEVSPCLGEVGVKVSLLGSTGETFMSLENFGCSSSSSGFGHNESTRWGTILVLLLVGIGLLHRSHEDIIGVLRESSVDISLIGAIDLSVHVWGENFTGVVIIITIASKLEIFKFWGMWVNVVSICVSSLCSVNTVLSVAFSLSVFANNFILKLIVVLIISWTVC